MPPAAIRLAGGLEATALEGQRRGGEVTLVIVSSELRADSHTPERRSQPCLGSTDNARLDCITSKACRHERSNRRVPSW